MNYLSKRTLSDKCPLCGKQFDVSKHINKYIKHLDQNLSYYQFSCASENHILHDYVSLYLNTTYYRRITCTKSPDCIQLHLDFTKNKSQVAVEIASQQNRAPIDFDHLLEDCNDIDKLLERLEIYQAFS